MAATPRTPLRRQTTALRNKADPALEVDVTVDNEPVRFVSITASQAPDPGLVHSFGVNEETPVIDVPGTTAVTVDMGDYPHLRDNNLPRSVWISAGKNATSFDVVSML